MLKLRDKEKLLIKIIYGNWGYKMYCLMQQNKKITIFIRWILKLLFLSFLLLGIRIQSFLTQKISLEYERNLIVVERNYIFSDYFLHQGAEDSKNKNYY